MILNVYHIISLENKINMLFVFLGYFSHIIIRKTLFRLNFFLSNIIFNNVSCDMYFFFNLLMFLFM